MPDGNTSKMWDFFESRVGLIITIGSIVVAAVMFIRGPTTVLKRDVALIKKDVQYNRQAIDDLANNEVKHLRQEITKLSEESDSRDKEIQSIRTELQTIEKLLKEIR